MRDSISVFSVQLEEKRNASCPATITDRNPITRMIGIRIHSGRSCLIVFMEEPVDWQSYVNCRAGVGRFVVSRAGQPDASAMGIDNAACDRQPKPRTAALEFRLARGVQKHFPGLVELFEDQFLILKVYPNPRIANGDLDLPLGGSLDQLSADRHTASIGRVFD